MDSLALGESPFWLPFEYLCAHRGNLAKPRGCEKSGAEDAHEGPPEV